MKPTIKQVLTITNLAWGNRTNFKDIPKGKDGKKNLSKLIPLRKGEKIIFQNIITDLSESVVFIPEKTNHILGYLNINEIPLNVSVKLMKLSAKTGLLKTVALY